MHQLLRIGKKWSMFDTEGVQGCQKGSLNVNCLKQVLRLEMKTLIHEVVGSNPPVVTLLVLPIGGGWIAHVKPAACRSGRFQLARTSLY